MSRFPLYEVYEVVLGDFMHNAGYAPGWYFDTPDDLHGPYRNEAIASAVCAGWREDAARALRRSQIAKLAYLTEQEMAAAAKGLDLTEQEAAEVARRRSELRKPVILPRGARPVAKDALGASDAAAPEVGRPGKVP